jgi:hypothetical protein
VEDAAEPVSSADIQVDVATSGVVHEDVDATMSSDDLGHCLVMARVSGRALASARITPASC